MLCGGILIACGHYATSVPTAGMTRVGLGLISASTGLLKPDVATMVDKLCRTDDDRRDAGFAHYYMAINIGAFTGPLITGRLCDHRGWHWGSSAAAIGMTFGLGQYAGGRRHLAGRKHAAEFAPAPASPTLEQARAGRPPSRRASRLMIAGLAATAAVTVLLTTADRLTMDRGRLHPYLVLFLALTVFNASTVFNFILVQAYSTMMLPASTNAETSILGFGFPADWYASALAAFEVALAPVVAAP